MMTAIQSDSRTPITAENRGKIEKILTSSSCWGEPYGGPLKTMKYPEKWIWEIQRGAAKEPLLPLPTLCLCQVRGQKERWREGEVVLPSVESKSFPPSGGGGNNSWDKMGKPQYGPAACTGQIWELPKQHIVMFAMSTGENENIN